MKHFEVQLDTTPTRCKILDKWYDIETHDKTKDQMIQECIIAHRPKNSTTSFCVLDKNEHPILVVVQ